MKEQRDGVEIDLTPEDITLGSQYSRKLVLQSTNPHYNGKTVEYRALTGKEFSKVMRKVGLSREQDPAESYEFLIAIGEIGIKNQSIASKFGDLDNDVITQLGNAILGITNVSDKDVDKFFQK